MTVEKQPALRTVCIPRPSKRKGKTGLAYAILHSIDLESCVNFRDDVEPGYTSQIVQDLHNAWDFTEPTRPYFKLVVVGRRDVYLVYSHAICDGMSGYIFHRTFLDALNGQAEQRPQSSWTSVVDPSTVELRPKLQDQINRAKAMGKPWGSALFETVWPMIIFLFLQLVIPRRLMFADLPSPAKPVISAQEIGKAKQEDRVRAGTVVDRIPKETAKKMLAKCRENGTTITCLWQTALMIALTNDYYPDCWLAGNRIATDVRFRLPEGLLEGDRNAMCNRGGGITHMERASKYRKVVHKSRNKLGEEVEVVDAEKAWELAREYRKWIIGGHDANIRSMATEGAQGVDLQDYLAKVYPMVGTMLCPTTLLSNLGPLKPNMEGDDNDKSWRFVDALFSAAPTHGMQGSRAPIYSLGGVQGGDMLMVSGWQEGVASRELAEGVFKATMARVEAMIAG